MSGAGSLDQALADIAAGKIIVLAGDRLRGGDIDLMIAARAVTPEAINFMATHGRGLICTPLEEKRADELGLDLMVNSNTALHETAFTVSIDLIGQGCSTGISAYDRATGIRWLTESAAKPSTPAALALACTTRSASPASTNSAPCGCTAPARWISSRSQLLRSA